MTYFDAAYLLKCYVKEPGWEQVRALARQHDRIACSVFGKMEIHAALHRKLREGDLTEQQLKTVFKQVDLDETQRLWTWLPLTDRIMSDVINSLRSMPGSVYLRTADVLHLITAKNNGLMVVYSNDTHLLAAAQRFGIEGQNVIPSR
jgi:predicted nucleic acid-binding protein